MANTQLDGQRDGLCFPLVQRRDDQGVGSNRRRSRYPILARAKIGPVFTTTGWVSGVPELIHQLAVVQVYGGNAKPMEAQQERRTVQPGQPRGHAG